jgi:OsmC-like protein
VPRRFTIDIDEPNELGGSNSFANPQEHLIAALNACMTVGYAAQCAARGITLESLAIETDGEIDLRGFLGIDPAVPKGFENLSYTVRIRGNGKRAVRRGPRGGNGELAQFLQFVPPRGPQTGVGRRVIARLEGRGSGCRQAAASLRHGLPAGDARLGASTDRCRHDAESRRLRHERVDGQPALDVKPP